jgi:hypothetical protein
VFAALRKNYVLPLVSAVVSFALFQLALHDPLNARTFSSLQLPSILGAQEFAGIYVHILARLIDSVIGDAELTFHILTALATGFSVYFVQKLFPRGDDWSYCFIAANVSFLYFACHSTSAMLAVLWFSAFLSILVGDAKNRFAIAGLIASLGLGIDSLVATGLVTYTLARVATAKEAAKWKATALASTLLGVVVWVLLAYMLYGSTEFNVALTSGFQDLFKQVNPINFGVGLVITFNLLLLWMFRAPAEKTSSRYLGSVLILLFLFVKVEPVHLVMLLITGVVYLFSTKALPKQKWVLPAYAVLNILAFFLLPNVRPIEASYNVRAEQPTEAAAYSSDFFAKHLPAYQSLVAKAGMYNAVDAKLRYEKFNVPVVLDPATEVAFDPAALRAIGSRRMIGGFNMPARRFKTVFDRDTSMIQSVKDWAYIRYVATEVLPKPIDSLLTAIKAPRVDQEGIRVYSIDSSNFNVFLDSYIYHHYLSYH